MLRVLNAKSTLTMLCFAWASVLHAGGPTPEAKNRIANPGFESSSADWKLFLAPRTDSGPSQQPVFEVVNDTKHTGNASARLTSDVGERYALKATGPAVDVAPGQRYRVSAWVHFDENAHLAQEGRPGAYIRLTLSQVSGKDIDDPLLHMHICLNGKAARSPAINKGVCNIYTLPKGWQKLEGVVEIPAGTKTITPELYVHGVVGAVNWDDVEMVEVSKSAPLSQMINE